MVKIIAAQCGITPGGFHLENALLHFQKRNIKGATAQIINGIKPLCPVIQAIGQGGGSWFIYQAQNLDPGQFGGILGCGTGGIIKIGRNRDHGLFHILLQRGFGSRFQGT